jgi:hypothetical protein
MRRAGKHEFNTSFLNPGRLNPLGIWLRGARVKVRCLVVTLPYTHSTRKKEAPPRQGFSNMNISKLLFLLIALAGLLVLLALLTLLAGLL